MRQGRIKWRVYRPERLRADRMPEPKTIPNRTAVDVEELRLDPLDFQNDKFDPEDEYRPEPPAEPLPPAWVDGSLRIGIHASIGGGRSEERRVGKECRSRW